MLHLFRTPATTLTALLTGFAGLALFDGDGSFGELGLSESDIAADLFSRT